MVETFSVRRFSDDVARILRERILSGDLEPGTRLNEVHLAEQYGISRSPIREALQALSGEGLVTFVAGRGAFVGGLTAEEVRELGQVRAALESHAARLVAEDSSPASLAALEGSIVVDESAGDVDDFHATLLRLSGNQRLEQLGLSIVSQLRLARSQSATRAGRVAEAVDEHRAVLEAIRSADPDGAARAMRDHVARATASATGS